MNHRRWSRLLFACLCAGAFGVAAPSAEADDPGAALKAQARALFEDAKKLAAQSKYAEACPKFEESQRLDAGLGTKFYLADCLEHLGKLASAWVLYLEVADEADDAKMKDRAEYARKRSDALAPKLTKMIVALADDTKAIPGLEVKRDGVVLKSAQWNTPLPIDAGKHTISISAPSKRTWETTVEASGEGSIVTVTIPTLHGDAEGLPTASATATAAPTATATATATASATATAAATAVAPPEAGWSTQRKVAVGLGAAGVAGLIVGGIFGGLAMDKVGASNKVCTAGTGGAKDVCTAEGGSLREDANTMANVSNAGFIAGGALAAAGVVLFLVAPARATAGKAGSGTKVGVVAGPRGAMFQLGREW